MPASMHPASKGMSAFRPALLSAVLALAVGGGIGWYSSAQAQSQPAAAPAPELVVGLPDFTRLVDQVGPACHTGTTSCFDAHLLLADAEAVR